MTPPLRVSLEEVSDRTVSPVFAGRETELTALANAFEQAASAAPATVLISGEAGAGKSRLVSEFAARVRKTAGSGGVLVLTGDCLEMNAAGLPYAPFTAAVRQLTRRLGIAEVTSLLPSRTAGDLAKLLPEFGEPSAGAEPATARARMFEQILTLLGRLAQAVPLILVVEDAHWADRSTRDLLSFIVTNVRPARLLVIVTFGSDEMHRTHPLRPLVTELSRFPQVSRLDLPRLQRAEVAAQLAGILGKTPEPAVVDTVYARTDGIPLFVEAMVSAGGTVDCRVPESLRDLLLDSINGLPDDTQQILRVASASRSRIGLASLAAVTGFAEQRLYAALRPALAANVLISDGYDYDFRHSLIREALHDDLLPGEHTTVHRLFAEALESDPSVLPAGRPSLQLALHWRRAHDYGRALPAAWQAAADAESSSACAEQLQMLEQVLDLWDQVPNAQQQVGTDHAGILERAARAARLAGESDRAIKLARAALSELDTAGAADADPAERIATLRDLCAMLTSMGYGEHRAALAVAHPARRSRPAEEPRTGMEPASAGMRCCAFRS